MSRGSNRSCAIAGFVLAMLALVLFFGRGHRPFADPKVAPDPTLSKRSQMVAEGRARSSRAEEARKADLDGSLTKYRLLWSELEKKRASLEERGELARRTARDLMLSDQMIDLMSFLGKRKISTGRSGLMNELSRLFHSDLADEARVSLIENLDHLGEFWGVVMLLEQSGTGLAEGDFDLFYQTVADFRPGYATRVLMGRNYERVKTEPLEALASALAVIESQSDAGQGQARSSYLRRVFAGVPVGREYDYAAMIDLLSDDSRKLDQAVSLSGQGEVFYRWAKAEPEEALREWKERDDGGVRGDAILRRLAKGAVSRGSFQDAQKWLTGLSENEDRDLVYLVAAESWSRRSESEAAVLAGQIQNPEVRKDAFRRIETVQAEMRMTPDQR